MVKKKMIHFYSLEFPVLTTTYDAMKPSEERVIEVLKRILNSDRFWKYFHYTGSSELDRYSIEQQMSFDFDLVDIDEYPTKPLMSPLSDREG